MDEKVKQRLLILGALLLLVLVAYIAGNKKGYDMARSEIKEEVRTDTIIRTDTVRLPAPPPDTVTQTKTKTVKVPLHDTVTLVDSVWVDLPFEQHFARLDSVADVWYSGYQAQIDSAIVYKHRQTIIEQHYINPNNTKEPTNFIGLEAGIKDASLVYMHRFGSFYVGISAGATYEGTATARGIVGFRF